MTISNSMYKTQGFSLIEMIGVMAIIAILAATIAPSVLKDIDRAVGEAEQNTLGLFAKDIETYIKENKAIPDRNNWATAIASVSSVNANNITQNKRFFTRRYYVDPRFFSQTDTNFNRYTQSNGLSNPPISPRIMIASNLKANLPINLNTFSDFDAVWNQTAGAIILESNDIKIERINLKNTFHRIILSKSIGTPDPGAPGYQLENQGVNSITTSNSEFYVLSDTKINLFQAPFSNNVIEKVFIANRSSSYHYEQNGSVWIWSSL